jgi:hypothetical protein
MEYEDHLSERDMSQAKKLRRQRQIEETWLANMKGKRDQNLQISE